MLYPTQIRSEGMHENAGTQRFGKLRDVRRPCGGDMEGGTL